MTIKTLFATIVATIAMLSSLASTAGSFNSYPLLANAPGAWASTLTQTLHKNGVVPIGNNEKYLSTMQAHYQQYVYNGMIFSSLYNGEKIAGNYEVMQAKKEVAAEICSNMWRYTHRLSPKAGKFNSAVTDLNNSTPFVDTADPFYHNLMVAKSTGKEEVQIAAYGIGKLKNQNSIEFALHRVNGFLGQGIRRNNLVVTIFEKYYYENGWGYQDMVSTNTGDGIMSFLVIPYTVNEINNFSSEKQAWQQCYNNAAIPSYY